MCLWRFLLFVEVLCVFRGFVCLWRFLLFEEVLWFVDVCTVLRGFVCLLKCCFCDSCLSSTKRPGSIFDEF